ncbi:aminotransferase class I/II-fold pyridoxal phosphate-dependent enzyme [Robiginitalea sp.]|uniref:aminotransferase class I/II-fold pyridoxal phosphate-dependent enzyme n=1 Tax=Robiginitalea sp. TaxID=1902411 RepID=UPI003C4ABAFE
MEDFPDKLLKKLRQRREEGAFRSLKSPISGVDFSSNDYLGFAQSEVENAVEFASGSTGSRLISGNHHLFEDTEAIVADFHEAQAALIFNSGFDANLGLLSALLQRNDYIFYDTSVHASIRDGIALGKAKSYKFDHNNLDSLRARVSRVLGGSIPEGSEVYVIAETVYSMEGDGPDITALAGYCQQEGYRLILDEAHAAGVLGPQGRGAVIEAGCEDLVFARIITFGKALGCHGAAILGSSMLKDYLINYSRSLIYTTALPPSGVYAISRAYEWLSGPEGSRAQESLRQNISLFTASIKERGLTGYFPEARAAIHCCEIGGNERVKALSTALRAKGYDVKPILSPTVARGRECLRFSLHAFNTAEEIRGVLTILEQSLKMKEE